MHRRINLVRAKPALGPILKSKGAGVHLASVQNSLVQDHAAWHVILNRFFISEARPVVTGPGEVGLAVETGSLDSPTPEPAFQVQGLTMHVISDYIEP